MQDLVIATTEAHVQTYLIVLSVLVTEAILVLIAVYVILDLEQWEINVVSNCVMQSLAFLNWRS